MQAPLAPALALLAAGCAHYTPAPLAAAPTLAPALPATTSAAPLAVEDVVALALARNPDLIAARTRLSVAQAQRTQAGVLPNPALTGALLPLVSGAGEVPAWNIGLAQDIKALLVYKPHVRSARAATAQVRADLLWQEWQVAGQARQLAVDLIAREQTRPLLDEAVRILGHRNAVTQAALAQGNATLVTAAPSAVGFQQARASLQTLDQTQVQDRHKLNALLGLTPDAIVPLQSVPQLPAFDMAAARAAIPTLPARRPDLLALRFGYLAQDETLRAAILAQFPDLILGGSASSDSSRVVNAGPNAQLGLPLFDRNQGNVAIARATRAQLQAEYAARLAATTGEVGALLGEMTQLQRQLMIVARDLPAARAAATRAAAAFGAAALDERAYVDLITNRFAKEQEVATLRLGLLDRQVVVSTLLGLGLPGVTTLGLADPGTQGAAR
ncbi:TolC family protein [Sphingomonas sp. MA1305]|uniref:TolC family protein n=1 Tax=Sphingomonas sp. MA1305 TaxID=2479204 RepID=UPI0018DFB1A4|nr:TolC family protein [Sphingomonas sp. MA1305]MBI0475225.1 TolC family protein [Sphingomonas sp. MA1305]